MKTVIVLVSLMIVGCISAFMFVPDLRMAAWTFFAVGITALVTKIVDRHLAMLVADETVKKASLRPRKGNTEGELRAREDLNDLGYTEDVKIRNYDEE